MKIEIENYRGWEIYFDTEKETFYAQSDEHARGESKKSFAAAKKFIDDFIKDNTEFKPIWVESPPSSWSGKNKIKLIGIRKDKRFIYEGDKGEKEQLPEYNEKDYILVNPDNEPIYEAIKVLQDKQKETALEIKALESKIIRVGLEEIKKKYTT